MAPLTPSQIASNTVPASNTVLTTTPWTNTSYYAPTASMYIATKYSCKVHGDIVPLQIVQLNSQKFCLNCLADLLRMFLAPLDETPHE